MKKSLLALMIATVSGVQAYAADFSVQSSNQASNQVNISDTTAEPGSAQGENRSVSNQAQADIASDNSAGLALTMDDVNVEQGVKQTIFSAVGLVNQQAIDVDKSNAAADAEQSQGLAVETLDGVVINLANSTTATMSSAADVTLDATHNLTADLKGEVETASAAVISGVEGAASAVKDAVTTSADLSAELSSSMQAAVEQDTQTVNESISEAVTANIDSSLSSQASGGLL